MLFQTYVLLQVWLIDASLTRKLLCLDPETGKLKVNLDHRIEVICRETDSFYKMKLKSPIVTETVFAKRNYFTLVYDSLQVRKIKVIINILKLFSVTLSFVYFN